MKKEKRSNEWITAAPAVTLVGANGCAVSLTRGPYIQKGRLTKQ